MKRKGGVLIFQASIQSLTTCYQRGNSEKESILAQVTQQVTSFRTEFSLFVDFCTLGTQKPLDQPPRVLWRLTLWGQGDHCVSGLKGVQC